MIESPEALLFEPLSTIDPDAPLDATKPTTEPDLLLVKQQPITSSFRRTVKHLQAKGGKAARFRGFSIYLVNAFLVSSVSQIMNFLPFVPRGTGAVLATIALANFSMAWTHIVISEPSPKPWYRRIPAARLWKKVAGPTAVLAIAEQLTILLPTTLSILFGLHDAPNEARNMNKQQVSMAGLKALSVAALGLILAFFLVLPANVTLSRVQASMLDDSEETIVPFDRSFGGKVVPEIIGGTGVIGLLDAWKTFDWNSRVRLVKAYVKVFAMQVAVSILFFVVMLGEVFLIVGTDFGRLLPENGKDGEI
jgi:hypothetical protein